MSTSITPAAIVRAHGEGERRWFHGGGVQTWKAHAEETGGAYHLFEHHMTAGKATPLHTHPSDETMIILEGEIVMHLDGVDQPVGVGGVAFAPRGMPHAFKVTTDVVRMLCLHTPGICEAFYRGASEPLEDGDDGSGVVNFDLVRASAEDNGGIELLGPPPFGPPR